MSVTVVLSSGVLFGASSVVSAGAKSSTVVSAAATSSAVVSAATPHVQVIQGWPSAASGGQVVEARSRHGPASRGGTAHPTLRSRTPPAKSSRQAPSHMPMPVEAMATMPVAFRSSAARSGAREEALKRVLCYGDSLTAGFCSGGAQFEPYGRALAEALGAAGVANEVLVCGHSGGLASDFVAKKKDRSIVDVVGCRGRGLARILSEDGPFDMVIIMAGTNDLGRNATPKEVLKSVKALHKECHSRGLPTVAVPPPPAPLRSASQEAVRLQLASLIEDWTRRAVSGAVMYQDPAVFVPASTGWIWEADKLHFSPAGSRCLGEGLAKVLLREGWISAVQHAPLTHRVQLPAPQQTTTPPLQQVSSKKTLITSADSAQTQTNNATGTGAVMAQAFPGFRCASSVIPPPAHPLHQRNVSLVYVL